MLIAYYSNIEMPTVREFFENGQNQVATFCFLVLAIRIFKYTPEKENKED